MSTKPMKALVALATVALLGSLLAGADSPAFASGCGLTGGEGTEVNPWRVSSEEDFAKVGTAACTLASAMTYYRQSASFPINTATAGVQVSETFAGVYDGDHHTITLTGDIPPFSNVSGTIKKLQLGGGIVAEYPATPPDTGAFDENPVGSLVGVLEGGTISEVGSAASIRVSSANAAIFVGGLVGSGEGLIQYSFFSGDFDIEPGGDANIGGLVGRQLDGSLWIRDSYARAHIEYDKSGSVLAGGLVGQSLGFPLHVVRSYAAGSFQADDPCPDDSCSTVFFGEGGLLGQATDSTTVQFVSAFFLASMAEGPVGRMPTAGKNTEPEGYSATSPAAGLPVAVKLDAATLRQITSYQSKGTGGDYISGPPASRQLGVPNPLAGLPEPGSTRLDYGSAPLDIDYLWAIEFADVSPFVAQKRQKDAVPGETMSYAAAFDRVSWANSPVPLASYSTRGTTSSSESYPAIGRVWEICSNVDVNDGFPVLVWEDLNCPGEGSDGGDDDRTGERPSDANLSAAQAAGLSGAELEAFLASGLTLEQWLAQRLAATGTSGEVLNLGLLVAGMLTIIGLGLVVSARRQNRGRLARPSP